MHDTHLLLEARARRTLEERIRPAQVTKLCDLKISAWQVSEPGGVCGQGEPVSFTEAIRQNYQPFGLGDPWGPAWGTTWFRLEAELPFQYHNQCNEPLELDLDLGWEDHSPGFQAEGLVYTPEGEIVKAINPRNTWINVPAPTSEHLVYYVEAAANPLLLGVPPFQPTAEGDKTTASPATIYQFRKAQLVKVNQTVREAAYDLEVLSQLALTLPENSPDRLRLSLGINQALDQLDLDDIVGSAPALRQALRPYLEDPALPGAHHLIAVGHAHIDSAWLWPLRETRRKVVRTIANVLRLLDDGHPMVFALPAAQHLAWLETDSPETFSRLQHWVKAGRIIPVGGMWVEPDAQLPGGEAMCRQMLYGQRYFAEKLGQTCNGVWLPDSFGYSPALPQIATLGGAKWFLTQKISWNQTDVFPHHTLWWEGIDGTRIFTHFPPVDTYGAEITAHQVQHASSNFKDKARASISLLPYGYGDGGGGPTRDMLARAARLSNLRGAPTISHDTPDAFFAQAKGEYPDAPVWVGELYLELHRGTSTTQANTKRGNRECESRLREAEMWLTHAAVLGLLDYPWEELESLWHTCLLAQFHDILPGTCIAWVYREVEAAHTHVITRAKALTNQAQKALCAPGETWAFNASPYPNCGMAALGFGPAEAANGSVEVTTDEHGIHLANGNIQVRIGPDGLIHSLLGADGREVVPPGEKLGCLWLYQDFPNMWDAWDIDQFYRETGQKLEATAVKALADGAEVTWKFSRSVVTIRYTLTAAPQPAAETTNQIDDRLPSNTVSPLDHAASDQTLNSPCNSANSYGANGLNVDVHAKWHEKEKLLKWQLPLDVHTDYASYETQMGHHRRPIHENTTWESNKFEVCAHRWIHLGEPGWGVGIVNSATYGWSHTRHSRPGGSTYTILGASLLRAPVFPDPQADQGPHDMSFTIVPGADLDTTRAAAYRLHLPLRQVTRLEDEPAPGSTFAPICPPPPTAAPDLSSEEKPAPTPASTAKKDPAWNPNPTDSGAESPAARLHSSEVVHPGHSTPPVPLIQQAHGLIIEAVKMAEDRSGDIIVRGYEPDGLRRVAQVDLDRPRKITACSILEDQPATLELPSVKQAGRQVKITLHPFQIVTLRIGGN